MMKNRVPIYVLAREALILLQEGQKRKLLKSCTYFLRPWTNVLRYLNFSDNAMGENGVNAFGSLLSSQNKLEELYLINMTTLNMCHNTREWHWHCDVIRKIKWLSEKGISIMIDTEGQANYEDFSDCRDIS
ncbi:hypothetical protein PS1_022596 [Malus domestica]